VYRYRLMMSCWDTDPAMRPTFEEVSASLTGLLQVESSLPATPAVLLPLRSPQVKYTLAWSGTDDEADIAL
jgi:hypothetical protein